MKARTLLACAFLLASAGWALAAATGDEIRAAIIGNTVQGNMDGTGAYQEFYDPDGTIKAADYTGAWSIDGDLMCFEYEDAPRDCWSLEINGDQVRWMKDGQSLGTGTIRSGNVNNF